MSPRPRLPARDSGSLASGAAPAALRSAKTRVPADFQELHGGNLMAKKTMTVRLFCTLDNGSKQWGPGDCPTLPEDDALALIKMGLAERLEAPKKARSAKTSREPQPPGGGQPESGQSSEDASGKTEDQQPQVPADPGGNAGDSTPEAGEGGENNG